MTNQEASEILKRIDRHDDWRPKLMPFEIEARDMAIKALEQQESERWIPVSERLPESNGTYIVTQDIHSVRNYGNVLKRETCEADFSQGEWKRNHNYEVIAWRPFPKTYQE